MTDRSDPTNMSGALIFHLRRAQMLEQLNEMASREPAELSGILRRWMRAAE